VRVRADRLGAADQPRAGRHVSGRPPALPLVLRVEPRPERSGKRACLTSGFTICFILPLPYYLPKGVQPRVVMETLGHSQRHDEHVHPCHAHPASGGCGEDGCHLLQPLKIKGSRPSSLHPFAAVLLRWLSKWLSKKHPGGSGKGRPCASPGDPSGQRLAFFRSSLYRVQRACASVPEKFVRRRTVDLADPAHPSVCSGIDSVRRWPCLCAAVGAGSGAQMGLHEPQPRAGHLRSGTA
jgi:hypothetical protein